MFQVSFYFPLSLFCCPPQGCLPVILSTTRIPTNPRCINTDRTWNPSERNSLQNKSHDIWIAHGLSKVKHPQVKYWPGRKAPALWQHCPAGLCQWHCCLGTWPPHSHTIQNTPMPWETVSWKELSGKWATDYIKGLLEQLVAPFQSVVAPHLVQFYYYSLNSPKMLGFSLPVNYRLLTEMHHFSGLLQG